MDGISGDLTAVVAQTLALKDGNRGAAIEVALMKNALDVQKTMGQEIARMLQVGTGLDVTA